MTTSITPGLTGAVVEPPARCSDLRHDTLSLFDSTAVAVSSVAPAYSLAATVALMVAAVGLLSPAALLTSFVPVLFIALAYFYLNRKDPNCGASYTWLARTVHPMAGWFNGWVQTAASVLFCIAAPVLAGQNTLGLFNSLGWISTKAASNVWLTVAMGLAWLIVITAICIYGIRLTTNFQWILVAIEFIAVLAFSVAAVVKVIAVDPAGSRPFSFGWLNPLSLHGISGLAAGAVLGVFFFWGWDTSANLNEESRHARHVPGQAGLLAMGMLVGLFLLNAIAIQMLVPESVINQQGGNALFYFAQHVAPGPLSYIMLLAILTSTVGTTQTTLLPAARVTLSMARDGVVPRMFGAVHPRWRTPWFGTLILAVIAAVGMIVTTASPSVNGVFQNLINNIGVLVAFYYGATGLGCAWAFRKASSQRIDLLLLVVVLPAASGLFLFWVGYQVVAQSGLIASLPILITFALGVPMTLWARRATKSDFFHRPPIAYRNVQHEETDQTDTAAEVAIA